jgi:hypothetical protein
MNGAMMKQLNDALKEIHEKTGELETTRRYLEDSNLKVKQMTDVNASFTSDLKIQRRIQSKMRKELEISESKRKQAESELEEERKKNAEMARIHKEMENHSTEQKSETLVAQKAIDKMNKGTDVDLSLFFV